MDERKGLAGLWARWKRPLFWFIVGLIVGPIISGYMGWQVRSATVQQKVQDTAVEEEAQMCEMLARQDTAKPSELDYLKRHKLAEKFADFPWDTSQKDLVVTRCEDRLAHEAPPTQDHNGKA